jgi:hypothetical protein
MDNCAAIDRATEAERRDIPTTGIMNGGMIMKSAKVFAYVINI